MSNNPGFPKLHFLQFYCRGCAHSLTIERKRKVLGKCPNCGETYRAMYDTLGGWMVQPIKIVSR